MKKLIQIIFFCILIAIITGYLFKYKDNNLTGDRIIGIAVLALSFILMPLFIFYRYRKKDISKYMFSGKQKKNNEESEEGEKQ